MLHGKCGKLHARYAADAWSDDEREAGAVIPETDGLRKVRWTREGTGKRGGARVIYYVRARHGQIVLVIAYAKAKFDDMPRSVLRKWKEALNESFDD